MSQKIFSAMMFLTLLIFFAIQRIQAQSEPPRTEIGAHFTYLSLDFGENYGTGDAAQKFLEANKGAGVRGTINLNRYFAVEGEINFFRSSRDYQPLTGNPFLSQRLNRKLGIEGLFGPKIGIRGKRIGIFGKVRPGFLRYTLTGQFISSPGNPFPISPSSETKTTAGLTVDLGGVAEYYPSRHTVIRIDIGDTMARFKRQSFRLDDRSSLGISNFTDHNLQLSVGVGFRF